MRDAVMESLKNELARRDAYENQVPICDICKQKMTSNEYFFDVYGTMVCDSFDCVQAFMRGFRRSIETYIDERSANV